MTHDTNRYIIGIDPDVDKSGYALIDMATKQVTVGTATLPVLLETIGIVQANAIANNKRLTVFVEAGWLNLNNWHLSFRDSKAMAAAKYKLTEPRLRKIISHIRINGIIPCLVSNGKGYYVATAPQEIDDCIASIQGRIDSHQALIESLKEQQQKYFI